MKLQKFNFFDIFRSVWKILCSVINFRICRQIWIWYQKLQKISKNFAIHWKFIFQRTLFCSNKYVFFNHLSNSFVVTKDFSSIVKIFSIIQLNSSSMISLMIVKSLITSIIQFIIELSDMSKKNLKMILCLIWNHACMIIVVIWICVILMLKNLKLTKSTFTCNGYFVFNISFFENVLWALLFSIFLFIICFNTRLNLQIL